MSKIIETTQRSTELENKNVKKNNFIDILSDKQVKSYTRKLGHGEEREIDSLLIAAQNNAIGTNYVKARIDKMQQNSKCWLCDDRDETIDYIISECSKLVQKRI